MIEIPKHIHDLRIKLDIDDEVRAIFRSGKLQPRIKLQEKGVCQFMRRCLEVAAGAAVIADEEKNSHGEGIWDSEKIADLCHGARVALEDMVDNLVPVRRGAVSKEAECAALAFVLHQIETQSTLDVRMSHYDIKKIADYDACVLSEALRVLSKLAVNYRAKRKRLSNSRKNPGAPDRLAFASFIMEGWIHLMGKTASEGSKQFQQLVAAAWRDVCTKSGDIDWSYAIRMARKNIEPNYVAALASAPPWWAI